MRSLGFVVPLLCVGLLCSSCRRNETKAPPRALASTQAPRSPATRSPVTGQPLRPSLHRAKAPAAAKARPFAVVELFTSEGCSSCPPADRLLTRLRRQAITQKLRLFPIAYHVDYWDHLGWRDRFGQRIFTRLQNAYVRSYGGRTLYTPQMIVNGRWQFLGSRDATAQRLIKKALGQTPSHALSLCQKRGTSLGIDFQVKPAAPGLLLQIAVLEWGLYSRPRSGENAGRTLRNDNVARVFLQHRLKPKSQGSLSIALPTGLKTSRSALLAFVQHPRTRRIVAAQQMSWGKSWCPR